MQYVTKHYGVEAQWKSYLGGSKQNNRAKIIAGYFKLAKL
jgi:hypothetical protein